VTTPAIIDIRPLRPILSGVASSGSLKKVPRCSGVTNKVAVSEPEREERKISTYPRASKFALVRISEGGRTLGCNKSKPVPFSGRVKVTRALLFWGTISGLRSA
jgi:hypothetical protein